MNPTDEQQNALDMFHFGDNLAIEAGAGTGKTSTLRLMADGTNRRGQYLAFNRAIVMDAKAKMPGNVSADTAHALAMRQVGRLYRHRLDASARQHSRQVAAMLDIGPLAISYGAQRKVLQPGYLAGLVQRAITVFCQSADDTPGREHVPYIDGIDLPTVDGRRTYTSNNAVRDHIADAIAKAWADLSNRDGQLRFKHEHYLKLWQLSKPRIPADFILFDEAQDASPVMLDVVANQTDTQLVFVGDSQQQIYEFTGAVNALAKVPAGQRTYLTRSFRFGEQIAERANLVLGEIGSPMRLTGNPAIRSTVGTLDKPGAILTRTNAAAMTAVLEAQKAGIRVHLIGDGKELVSFATAAGQLMAGEDTWHPELACFTTWGEVQTYVADDPQGSELALMVKLVDDYGVETILSALRNMVDERGAELVVSTAHKAKGCEWSRVQIADDFPDPRESFEAMLDPTLSHPELRLIYVAVTRARHRLDVDQVPYFDCGPATRVM
jgi:hypothetical protein